MDAPKLEIGDLAIYNDLLGKVKNVDFDGNGFVYFIGSFCVKESEIRKADWRDVTRITKRK